MLIDGNELRAKFFALTKKSAESLDDSDKKNHPLISTITQLNLWLTETTLKIQLPFEFEDFIDLFTNLDKHINKLKQDCEKANPKALKAKTPKQLKKLKRLITKHEILPTFIEQYLPEYFKIIIGYLKQGLDEMADNKKELAKRISVLKTLESELELELSGDLIQDCLPVEQSDPWVGPVSVPPLPLDRSSPLIIEEPEKIQERKKAKKPKYETRLILKIGPNGRTTTCFARVEVGNPKARPIEFEPIARSPDYYAP